MKDYSKLSKEELIHELELAQKKLDNVNNDLKLQKAETIQELQKERNLLYKIIEGTTDVIYLKDSEGCYRLLNDAAADVMGRQKKEIIGKKDTDILPDEIAQMNITIDNIVFEAGKPYTYENRFSMNNANKVFHTTKTPFFDESGSVMGIIGIARDMTIQKQNGEQLYNMKTRYQAILSTIPDIIAEQNIHNRFTWVNRAGREFFGEDVVGKEISYYTVSKGFDTNFVDKLSDTTDNLVSIECWLRRKDNHLRLLAWRVRAIYDKNGNISGTLSIASDITEFREMFNALQEKKEQIQLLLNSTGEAIFGLDNNGYCTFVNPSCIKTLGYKDPLQLIGKNMHKLVHHTYRNGLPYPSENCPIYQTINSGKETVVNEDLFWCKDGSPLPVEYSSFPIYKSDKIIGSVVTFRDITERMKLNAHIQEWKNRYEAAILATGNILYDWDIDKNKVIYGGDLENTLGFSGEELSDGFECWQKLVHPADREYYQEVMQNAMKTKESINIEYRIRKKSGEYIYVEDSCRFFADACGNYVRMLGFVKDITERKRIMERLMRTEKTHTLGIIVAGLAHEINNPIGAIYICTKENKKIFRGICSIYDSILKLEDVISKNANYLKEMYISENFYHTDKLNTPCQKDIKAIINDLQKSSKALRNKINIIKSNVPSMSDFFDDALKESLRCKNLVRSLVSMAQQRGKEPQKESVNINEVVEKVIDTYKYQISNRKIDVSCIARSVPDIMADFNQIELVISNIVNNAFLAVEEACKSDYQPKKNRKKLLKLETDYLEDKGLVVVAVKDTGVGIDKKYKKKIFDPFFSKCRIKKGTGLGLSLVSLLTELHGGFVDVKSKLGRGTIFKVFLPVDD